MTATDAPLRNDPITARVLALAGLVQALAQVRRVADTGQAEESILATAMDSVFRIDAESVAAVYGGTAALRPGLQLLRDYFAGNARDGQLPKLAFSVMQLERRFSGEPQVVARVQAGIRGCAAAAARDGSSNPDVLAAMGALYSDTLSSLRPRILIQGNPHYLAQSAVVSEVRAVLLAAIRSATLWRQVGGGTLDFFLRRRQMTAAVDALL
ncbi:lysogenization regulator HflD [Lysobacter sp. GX 14042]|uniref:lysogenization protein HflD n=1 Tax=Lysobacter sp. GX 14042 TaxID=2907155 RepID=UPI001F21DD71|nr:lysogenization regulator HflD [Lysobacter sp. GX 14042]MCE7031337.1 lysogenization regulator HflD [Lysobacter sp. GX 14042]